MSLVVLALPLLGAGVVALVAARWRSPLTLTVLVLTLLSGALMAQGVGSGGARVVTLAAVGLPAAVVVEDGLSAALVLVSSGLALATALFGVLHRDAGAGPPAAYWPLSLALLAGLHGLFLAGDLLTAYLWLEVVAVAGAALVAWRGDGARMAAATRYFYAELVASVTFLAGTALVWSATGTVVITDLAGQVGDSTGGRLGLALLTTGLLLKVPVVPLHFWLPAAHTLAPSAVSPLLSGLVVKSAFVILLRTWVGGVPEVGQPTLALLLGVLGAVAVLWGGLTALRVERAKVLVAYSTVSQLGLLLLAVPLAVAGSGEAWLGAAFHAIAHALPKAALLMAVALLAHTMGGGTVDRLTGAAARRPVAAFAAGLAALSLVGLPPTGGFVAKWYLVVASLTTGQWWWAATIVAGSFLTAAYLARLLQRFFRGAGRTVAGESEPAERGRADVVALGLAAAGLLLGLYPNALLGLLDVGAPLGVMARG